MKNISTPIFENSYLETIHYTEALQDYLNKPIHTFYKINIPKFTHRQVVTFYFCSLPHWLYFTIKIFIFIYVGYCWITSNLIQKLCKTNKKVGKTVCLTSHVYKIPTKTLSLPHVKGKNITTVSEKLHFYIPSLDSLYKL